MGRYSTKLVQSVIGQDKYDQVIILLAKNLVDDNPLSLDESKNLFPKARIEYLDLYDASGHKYEKAKAHNAKVLSEFIATLTSQTIDFLVLAPFQEPTVAAFPSGVKKVALFYDLIPYLYFNRYKTLMPYEAYLKRLGLFFEAEVVLTISKSARDDLVSFIGMPKNRVKIIDGAAFSAESHPSMPENMSLPEKYILMPTGNDARKNNLRAVLGFEEFKSSQGENYKLVITSSFSRREKIRLQTFSQNLIFTDNIVESELEWLFHHCEAMLFIPESEGLGMPILEAVQAGRRVVCSDIPVFREISDDAFYFCDHEDQHAVARALRDAVSKTDWDAKKNTYSKILKYYSWLATAKRAISAMDSSEPALITPEQKRRIAIFTPVPEGISAIGKVVQEAHAAMSEYFEIDYYAEKGLSRDPTRPNFLQYVARNYYDATEFSVERYCQYDAVIYHVGNSDYHLESIKNALYLPGYVILHDTNISEAYRILAQKGMISTQRFDLERTISSARGVRMSSCVASVVSRQLGVLAHSRYARDAVVEAGGVEGVCVVANLATNVGDYSRQRSQERLTVGLAGIIADIKGLKVLKDLASDSSFAGVQFSLFGYNYANKESLQEIANYPNVRVATNVSDLEFQGQLNRLDIFVNYRMKYQGETSLSTIEAMRQGVVVIVRDIGWYSELPDDVVIKVKDEDHLKKRLKEIAGDRDELLKISRRAYDYVRTECDYTQYVARLRELIDSDSPQYNRGIAGKIRTGIVKSDDDLSSLLRESSE
jgi:glycosyltransferase involved in cell wall biosynthesis